MPERESRLSVVIEVNLISDVKACFLQVISIFFVPKLPSIHLHSACLQQGHLVAEPFDVISVHQRVEPPLRASVHRGMFERGVANLPFTYMHSAQQSSQA